MSSNLNTVLAECEKRARELTEAAAEYEAASAISDKLARSLYSLFEALQELKQHVEPFTTTFSRRVMWVFGGLLLSNTLLLLVTLVLLVMR